MINWFITTTSASHNERHEAEKIWPIAEILRPEKSWNQRIGKFVIFLEPTLISFKKSAKFYTQDLQLFEKIARWRKIQAISAQPRETDCFSAVIKWPEKPETTTMQTKKKVPYHGPERYEAESLWRRMKGTFSLPRSRTLLRGNETMEWIEQNNHRTVLNADTRAWYDLGMKNRSSPRSEREHVEGLLPWQS